MAARCARSQYTVIRSQFNEGGRRTSSHEMTSNQPQGIWPPHEVFYLESMLLCTSAALVAADDLRAALRRGAYHSQDSQEWQDCAYIVVNAVHTMATQAAALSRYFWPIRDREPHKSRAARLRASLAVSEKSPLRNRDLRNRLEHFDERLDEFCQNFVAGVILPTYVGPLQVPGGVPTHRFRAYYTDIGVLEVLGVRLELQPIVDEIHDLHNRLVNCGERGGRLPDHISGPGA